MQSEAQALAEEGGFFAMLDYLELLPVIPATSTKVKLHSKTE